MLYFIIFVLVTLLILMSFMVYSGSEEHKKLHVSGRWLNEIAEGRKTIEGRPGPKHKWESWIGAPVLLFNNELNVLVEITKVDHFDTLDDYLDKYWKQAAPHLTSRDETKKEYNKFYSDEMVKTRGGMNALHLKIFK